MKTKLTVYFIDWASPGENIFDIAEEVTVVANNEKRPDLVIYLNGIAVAVIEKKKGTGIRVQRHPSESDQSARNVYRAVFTTIQFCMAGNDSEGMRYGTIKTPEKNYLEWKKDGFTEYPEERHEIDVHIEAICDTIPPKLDASFLYVNSIHPMVQVFTTDCLRDSKIAPL